MATETVSIANETTLQEIKNNIGNSSDPSSAEDDATLFSKLKYAKGRVDNFTTNTTNLAKIAKADNIGTDNDTTNSTLFGLAYNIKKDLGTNQLSTVEHNGSKSGNGTEILQWTPNYSRVWNIISSIRNAEVVIADHEITSKTDGVELMKYHSTGIESTFARCIANAYLTKGITYYIYLFSWSESPITPESSYLHLKSYKKNESIMDATLQASNRIQSGLISPLDNATGTGSTATSVGKYTLNKTGTIRLNITKPNQRQ